MQSKPKLVLVGGGGHCKVLISMLKKISLYEIVGISDLNSAQNNEVDGIYVKYTDDDLQRVYHSGVEYALVSLGSIGNASNRIRLFDLIKGLGFKIPTIVSTDAIVDDSVKISIGTVIMPGVIINTSVTIGCNCIINTGAIIDHDCTIGNHVHIAPGVTISGSVCIGDSAHIGTGASIIQNILIGNDALVGAGSVVVKNIPDSVKVFGVPAKERKLH